MPLKFGAVWTPEIKFVHITWYFSTDQGAELDVDEAILDGEVITADETGRPQFYDLLRRRRGPAYVAFDVLWMTYYGKTLSKKLSYGTKVTSYGIGRSVRLGKPRAP
jgi:hypothetical protein